MGDIQLPHLPDLESLKQLPLVQVGGSKQTIFVRDWVRAISTQRAQKWRIHHLPRLAPKSLHLSETERNELQQLVNRHSTPQQIALRARIIELADDGLQRFLYKSDSL